MTQYDSKTSASGDGANSLTYKDAGVDIEAADAFVSRIRGLAQSTRTPGVLDNPGAYAGLFRPDLTGISQPVLAAACDGVGTKLMVAREVGQFEGLGQDLVAMNVNDLLPSGARPLFFLDYIATGAIDTQALEAVMKGIARACSETGCALLGGETAEMPGVYAPGEFDLAGFTVGLVDTSAMPKGGVVPGDRVLALPSSGVHSNGLSLARKALLDRGGLKLSDNTLGRPLGIELLEPTRLYVNAVLDLMKTVELKAAAHVTGGGLIGRGFKLAPEGAQIVLNRDAYDIPPIFELIRQTGNVDHNELARTFNMGLGFLAVVSSVELDSKRDEIASDWLEVGEIVAGARGIDLGYARS